MRLRLLHFIHTLVHDGMNNLWVEFGTVEKRQLIPCIAWLNEWASLPTVFWWRIMHSLETMSLAELALNTNQK